LPQDANAWGTLGAAHDRAGDWPAAAAALEKSRSLRDGDDPEDLFFRAMTCWQLGNKDQARQCYDRAVQLMEKQPTHYKGRLEDLRRFRAEAAELLGIKK
jgi:uncharacterized protein HemY